MCLSIPARIIKIDGSVAEVSVGGTIFRAGLQMVQNAVVDDYILVHAGFAIQIISEEEAIETLKLIDETDEALNQ